MVNTLIKNELKKITLFFLDLPRGKKLILSLIVDSFLCFFTVWLAFLLRLGEIPNKYELIFFPTVISIFFAIPVFYLSGLYRTIFRYSGWAAMLTVSKSVLIYGFLFSILITLISFQDIPRTVGIIQPLLMFFAVSASRAYVSYWLGDIYKTRIKSSNYPNAIIYGAGNAGRQLLISLENHGGFKIYGFIDDDLEKQGRLLCGRKIYSPKSLKNLVEQEYISYLFLALPGISRVKRSKIIDKVIGYNLIVKTLPNIAELAKGKFDRNDLQELGIDDLIGRDKVNPEKNLMQKNIKSKIVLVTGAGGTIGSQLCREILKMRPAKLLLLDSSEYSLYSILNELESLNKSKDIHIIPLLASIQDKKNINLIFKTWKPNTVYHAAAYKHVPIVEHNLLEGIKNNVIGTLLIAKASKLNKVSDFVFISTDKAVRPTNVMGATKRLCELCLQALYEEKSNNNTKFSMVRFGNVLESSGSVIPKFRKQIKERKPLTVTHRDICRYFMSIEEAAELVIQAGAMAAGGDVFVLDMGSPVKIYELARKMIQMAGLKLKDRNNPNGDIEIVITGLRPGEKLYEELLISNDPLPTNHPKIFKAKDNFILWHELEPDLKLLENLLLKNDQENSLKLLKKLVPGYCPPKKIVDWIFNEKLRKES
tara:strand:+ start:10117 stop:12066 length:1950 start_codon:yes stop_codon:yes gene_type:complete